MDFIKKILRLYGSLVRCIFNWVEIWFSFSLWKKIKSAFAAFIGLVILWATIGYLDRAWEFRDDHPERGAKVVNTADDVFGDSFSSIRYLDQGWDNDDSMWFYYITQGSNLVPYDFFLELEVADSQMKFRDDKNILHYRYLPQEPSDLNPDGLPVGMAKDHYDGRTYMGFTCAACHTTQVNYGGVGIRIDGGPAMADMENFMAGLASALEKTRENDEKLARFSKAVIAHGEYDDVEEIKDDLERFARRIRSYVIINSPRSTTSPLTSYGYARLDAFGRIFNRVSEHVSSPESLLDAFSRVLNPEKYEIVVNALEPVFEADDLSHLLDKVLEVSTRENLLTPKELVSLRNEIFNPADAPVSYPFLWDIPQHDYVQWNGVVGNSGIGPMGRNAGQVIGVFGTLNWRQEDSLSLSSFLTGQGLYGEHVRFDSSINIRNLRRVETHLRDLYSPLWPEDILPNLDDKRVDAGKKIFDRYCEACHERIIRDDPNRRVVAFMSGLDDVGTDTKMAMNSVTAAGYSGIVKDQYVGVGGVGDILMERKAPLAALLTKTTGNVIVTPDPDKNVIQHWAERIFDLLWTFADNEVKASMKKGTYDPATSAEPIKDLLAYKGRPLNGIWATAPYLHNGSIPTLYHLLLPKKRDGDPEDGEYRPDEFYVGSRAFLPDLVGFDYADEQGFRFDTSIYGNHNTGHEYAAGKTPLPDGTTLEPLTREQRLDLLEYLKSL